MKKEIKSGITLVACIVITSINNLDLLLPMAFALLVFVEIAYRKELKDFRRYIFTKLDNLLFEEI